jgi:hypothetical protein
MNRFAATPAMKSPESPHMDKRTTAPPALDHAKPEPYFVPVHEASKTR